MSIRSVLCVLLLSTCSVEIVTQSMIAEGYSARRSTAKDTMRPDRYEVDLFPAEKIQSGFSGLVFTGHVTRNRRKRTTKIISFAARKASKILRKLLQQTQKLPQTNKHIKRCIKQGSFLNAVSDFYLFGPTKIAVYYERGVKIMVGEAGDKIIRLKGTGTSDLPELDVRKKMNPGDETSTIYRIIYKE